METVLRFLVTQSENNNTLLETYEINNNTRLYDKVQTIFC